MRADCGPGGRRWRSSTRVPATRTPSRGPDQGWKLRGTFSRLDAAGLSFSWRWDHQPELPDRDVAVTLLPPATPGWATLRLVLGPYDLPAM